MYVDIAPGRLPGAVVLREAADCGRLKVVAHGGDREEVEAALAPYGRFEDAETVWLSIEGLRELAGGGVEEAWSGDFAGMLAYATTKGWIDTDRREVRAHCEWPTPGPE